jgi:DNA-binding NtrC family response regulator
MNILIAENEMYLAQSISNALMDKYKNSKLEIVTTTNDALNSKKDYDILIMSATLNGNIYPVIEKYKNSIIILLVPYINHDTVTAPMNAGVDTYILKPFMIEELIRKINHHLEVKQLKKEFQSYESYLKIMFDGYGEVKFGKVDFPLFIKAKSRKKIDKAMFDLSKQTNLPISFFDLQNNFDLNAIKKDNNLLYLMNFDTLKASAISKLFDTISDKKVVIELKMDSSFEHPNLIVLESDDKEVGDDEILSVEEYIKHIIKNYENRFPDTELSKKLGISRKSLWEKRKKYGLTKKK